jgi:hypothetical protein
MHRLPKAIRMIAAVLRHTPEQIIGDANKKSRGVGGPRDAGTVAEEIDHLTNIHGDINKRILKNRNYLNMSLKPIINSKFIISM